MQRFTKMIKACTESAVTDLYLTGTHPVVFRKNGKCYPQKSIIFSPEEVDSLANTLLEERHKRILRARWSVDFGLSIAGVNLRCNCTNTNRGLSFTFRFLPGRPPSIENLNLHPTIHEICKAKTGLILFCGPTGSGKTSTIASMINEINSNREAHIMTLEDPIEYRFQSLKGFIQQREMGVHFHDFEQGLLDCLRQMPDVIMVGEMREREIIRQTLNIAESGHLVFSTLHASSPEEAIYRICNAFPMETQELVRYQLASTIQAVIVQNLVMNEKLGFRVPVLSILRNSPSVKNTLRENKLSQLDSIVEMGQQEDMFTFKRYQTEFLDKKDKFMPPSASFQTAKSGVGIERTWRSPLINFDAGIPGVDDGSQPPTVQHFHVEPRQAQQAGQPAPHPASRRMAPMPAAAHDGDEEHGGGGSLYHIEEEASYEELISQLKGQ